ncbi:golgin subfamily A member 6-like protein 22, partial [Lethenteron reissneri]|uniref:golgin subfamily A member 6-like protein 22 n=1 Tax=Lethenteron reissneri TaxID=7753 RepID=UPI002AB79332
HTKQRYRCLVCGCLRLPAPCDGSSRACCVLARRGWARWRSRWSSCGRGTVALTLAECSNTVERHQRDTLDNAAKGVVVKIPLGGRISHNTGRERRRRCPHPPRLPRPKWLTVVVEEEETPVEELLVQEEETLVEELVVQEEEILVEELVVQEEETLLEELVVQEEETLVEELVVQKEETLVEELVVQEEETLVEELVVQEEETLVEELVVQEEETLVQELVVQEEEEMRGETEELWTKEQEDEMVVQVEETLVEKMVEKEMTRKEDQVMMQEEKRKRGSLARIGRTIRSLLRLVLLCGSRSTTQ